MHSNDFQHADFAPFDFSYQRDQARRLRLDREAMNRNGARRAADADAAHVNLPGFEDTIPMMHGGEVIEPEEIIDRDKRELMAVAEYIVARIAFMIVIKEYGYFPPRDASVAQTLVRLHRTGHGKLLGVA
jgi:hypothetical protein